MSPRISRPLSIEIALLGYLCSGPKHGYQIHQQHAAPFGLGRIWYLKQAQLYKLLGKLEEAGYLWTSLEPQEARPARRMFHLTPEGQTVYRAWCARPVERPRQMRTEFHLKLYFARQEGFEVCTLLVNEQKKVCQEWLEAHPIAPPCDADAYLRLVNRYRLGQIQAILDWLDLCQAELGSQAGA